MKTWIFLAVLLLGLGDKRKPGNPLDHLPKNIEVLTHFGDAMTIDLNTRNIRCLTCNVPAAVFLRVMHLATGDYILIGPDHVENFNISRSRDSELWFLSKERGAKPVKLEQKMSDGAAVLKLSYSRNAICWIRSMDDRTADGKISSIFHPTITLKYNHKT